MLNAKDKEKKLKEARVMTHYSQKYPSKFNSCLLIRNNVGQKAVGRYTQHSEERKNQSTKNLISSKLSFRNEGYVKHFQRNKKGENLLLADLPYKKY